MLFLSYAPQGGLVTDLSAWDFSETKSGGHYLLVPGGLKVWTDSNTTQDKVAGYIDQEYLLSEDKNTLMPEFLTILTIE